MLKRFFFSGLAILVAWMVLDLLLHRFFLASCCALSFNLWRPFNHLHIPLICAVTLTLISAFVGTYHLLVAPKSLRSGLIFGALMGLALGVSAGFGTYIHLPIPLAIAWGWLIGGF
jgi:hypothetical protein